AASFRDLLYSESKGRGRFECSLGTAPATHHFPRNSSPVAGSCARHPSLRALPALRAVRNKESGMAGYAGVDYIDFDSQLNDEEKLVRQTARQFVENEIIPIIERHSREATFPKHLIPQLGELGFFGANLHGYGCAGMSNVAYGLMTQELERGDSGLRSFVSVQGALVMYPIYSYGSDAQKNKWLPLLQQGKAIGCFGLTEPQFGSNPGGMLTRAGRRHGVLRHGAAIPEDPQAVREQAHGVASTRAGKAGVDDHGKCEGPVAGAARGPAER